MDKNAIKKYAVWAREELIKRVSKKAEQYGISDNNTIDENAIAFGDNVLSDTEIKQRKELIAKIRAKGYEQVIDEVAYTWFNRFSAIRFMEVNNYLPSRVRVFTDAENNFKPQILDEAIHLELDGLKMDKVLELKDQNKTDELYKYLLITQCNALSKILPGMFQKINDYTELLFPDNILREGSVVEQMITLIPEEDWQDAVQIIGWLYQYYNTAVLSKLNIKDAVERKNLPAKTQFFTPDWIVRYMVENSLGRLWVEGHPNEDLKANWKYYLEEAEQEETVKAQLETIRKEYANMKPEDIKCIDPCMGSGHILVYMFDVFMQIYECYGYGSREAVESIVANNIYGLDIDERAAQLSYFAIMMKARQYDRRFFSRDIQPNVYAICESNDIDRSAVEYFIDNDKDLKIAMETIILEMHDATEYGSLVNVTNVDFNKIFARFEEIEDDVNIYKELVKMQLLPLTKVAFAMAQKYDVVVTNPPYLGIKKYNKKLSLFVNKTYKDVKYDLFSCFILKSLNLLSDNGIVSLITQQTWINVDSFEKLRIAMLNNRLISLLQLGANALDGGLGTASFVVSKTFLSKYKSSFINLLNGDSEEKLFNFKNNIEIHKKNIESFLSIPKTVYAYEMNDKILNLFKTYPKVENIVIPRSGLVTRNNDLFLKLWYEVDYGNIDFECDLICYEKQWYPHIKGGAYRKWYGNYEYVVNWKNNGSDIRYATRNANGGSIVSQEYYFHCGLSWSLSTFSTSFSMRVLPKGFIFNVEAPAIFDVPQENYIHSLLNTKVGKIILDILSDDVHYKTKDVGNMPYKFQENAIIDEKTKQNILLSKTDWDSFETSWDFVKHPLIVSPRERKDQLSLNMHSAERKREVSSLARRFELWKTQSTDRFDTLKANEEELNRIFIDIYGLQDELTPEVEDKDVTVRLADKTRDIKSFISYAVGCMFGRYSLDVDGLAYAGGEFDRSKYTSFSADTDNIIPICSDEYFEDDITGRFIKFVETVYGKDTLQANLQFIADALGGKGTSSEVIRNYFVNDFYNDHCKMYQKRPIYWLFDSGKKGGFKALIYMHRYQQDTIARMRTDYVHEQQGRYRTEISDLETRIASASTSERVKLNKELSILQDRATEIREYEEKIHHLADKMIRIDLDDGVKNNYAIFQDVLAKIK